MRNLHILPYSLTGEAPQCPAFLLRGDHYPEAGVSSAHMFICLLHVCRFGIVLHVFKHDGNVIILALSWNVLLSLIRAHVQA